MLAIVCGDNYPASPPEFKFVSKVNLPCVNASTGRVENSFRMFKNWSADSTLETILIGLKHEMISSKKLPQPADGEMY